MSNTIMTAAKTSTMLSAMNSSTRITITATDEQRPFDIGGCSQFDLMTSSGDVRRIFVYRPPVEPPSGGYPVVYVLDGNAVFATAVETVRMQMQRPADTGVPPAVVIGIGYPIDGPFDVYRRRLDYTPNRNAEGIGGGAESFAAFIADELKPVIESQLPIDAQQQALFGHSLGGLFALWSLFSRRLPFATYMAASPSIWWGGRSVLDDEAGFELTDFRLLLTVGGLEQGAGKRAPDGRPSTMVDDVKAMAARLRARFDSSRIVDVEFPDETHISVVPAALSRSVRFAWSND